MAETRYVSFSERYMAGEDPEKLIVEADQRIEQHCVYIEELRALLREVWEAYGRAPDRRIQAALEGRNAE